MMLIDPFRSGPTSIEFIETQPSVDPTAAHTIPGVSFGSPGRGRFVLLLVHRWSNSASNFVSASINGVSASLAMTYSREDPAAGFKSLDIIIARVPTGTTGTVQIDYDFDARLFVGVFGVRSLKSLTAKDSSGIGFVTNTANVSTDFVSGGIAVSGICAISVNSVALTAGAAPLYSVNWFTGGDIILWAAAGIASETSRESGHVFTYFTPSTDGSAMNGAAIAASFR